MRIGLIIYGDLETLTGGFLYDRMLVNYLRAQGDQVEVIALPWRNYVRHLADNFSLALFRRLRDARFDLLIQDELVHPSFFLINRWLKKRAHCPLVTIVHLLRSSETRAALLGGLYRATERQYLKSVDGAIVYCDTTRTTIEQVMGLNLPGIVAPPGCDHLSSEYSLEEVAERVRQPGPLQILSIANLLPNKGLSILIEALTRLPPSSWKLRVAGSLTMDRGYVQAIRNQIAQAGLSNHVSLLGVVPNDKIPAYLAGSHVLAVPSYYEAFGIAYLEAMRFGLPVIATTAGGAHEFITDGQEGFLIPPGDTNTLAHRLQEINRDRERLLRMSLAAYKRIQTHPTWAESMGRIREFLQALVNADDAIGLLSASSI